MSGGDWMILLVIIVLPIVAYSVGYSLGRYRRAKYDLEHFGETAQQRLIRNAVDAQPFI